MKKDNAQKVLYMVLSLLIAFAAWGYCVVEVDPSSSQQIKNIEIEYLGTEILEQSNWAITSGYVDSLNVTVTGQRTALAGVKAGAFIATCDVSSVREGNNRLIVHVRAPEGLRIENQSVQHVNLKVESVITVSKPVVGYIIKQDADSDVAEILSVSKDSVKVTGPQSYVDSVSHVNAIVDARLLGNEPTILQSNLEAVNKDGAPVDGVTLGRTYVTVRAILNAPGSNFDKEKYIEDVENAENDQDEDEGETGEDPQDENNDEGDQDGNTDGDGDDKPDVTEPSEGNEPGPDEHGGEGSDSPEAQGN